MDDDGLDRPYVRHAFVCTTGPWCLGLPLQKQMKEGLKDSGLRDEVRVNQSGCLNQCGHGPMMVVYPEGTWYAGLDADKAKRVLEEHLIAGRPVKDLKWRPAKKGANKTPEVQAADRAKKLAGKPTE